MSTDIKASGAAISGDADDVFVPNEQTLLAFGAWMIDTYERWRIVFAWWARHIGLRQDLVGLISWSEKIGKGEVGRNWVEFNTALESFANRAERLSAGSKNGD